MKAQWSGGTCASQEIFMIEGFFLKLYVSWEEIEERKIKWFGRLAKSGVFSMQSYFALEAESKVPIP